MRDTDEDIELSPEEGEGPERSEGEDERAEAKFAKLREEIAALRKEKQEYMDGWQRAKADYVNALKRFEGEAKQERARGVIKAAEALLPALDALERAKEHGEVPEGFASIGKQLEAGFAALHLEPMGAIGETFDLALHEALGTDAARSAGEDDTVSAVLERGWRLDDVLIRPAKVRVYRSS